MAVEEGDKIIDIKCSGRGDSLFLEITNLTDRQKAAVAAAVRDPINRIICEVLGGEIVDDATGPGLETRQ